MSNKQGILDYIENNKYDYVEISHRIHERPELVAMKKFLRLERL